MRRGEGKGRRQRLRVGHRGHDERDEGEDRIVDVRTAQVAEHLSET